MHENVGIVPDAEVDLEAGLGCCEAFTSYEAALLAATTLMVTLKAACAVYRSREGRYVASMNPLLNARLERLGAVLVEVV